MWLIRRVAVLTQGTSNGEIEMTPTHIGEADMVADPLTKYLTYPVWVGEAHAIPA